MRPLFDDLSFPPFVHCPELDVVAVGKVPDEELLDGAVGEVGVGSLFHVSGFFTFAFSVAIFEIFSFVVGELDESRVFGYGQSGRRCPSAEQFQHRPFFWIPSQECSKLKESARLQPTAMP